MTGNGFEVTAPALTAHADSVDSVADQVLDGRSAGARVTLGRAAYGQLCQFLPGLLSALFGSAAEAINDAVDALGETALRLRATATDMTAVDAGTARRLDSAAGPGLALPL